MLVSFNWLKEFVDIDISPEQVADLLTMGGIEVDSRGQTSLPGGFSGASSLPNFYQYDVPLYDENGNLDDRASKLCSPERWNASLQDEYPDLLDDPRAEHLAKHTFMIEEFLVGLHEKGELDLPFSDGARSILLHGHCHQKALVGSSPSLQVLRLLPGVKVEEVDSGCCGMAGSFGYEKEHYELSLAIGSRRLFPAVKARGPECEIVAAGISCRQQIAHGTGRRARHLVEVLAAALP